MGRKAPPHAPGVVPVAIFRIRTSLPITLVGVRRRLILDHSLDYRLIPVDRLARDLERAALILVIRHAMLVLAHLALLWDQRRTVSVV